MPKVVGDAAQLLPRDLERVLAKVRHGVDAVTRGTYSEPEPEDRRLGSAAARAAGRPGREADLVGARAGGAARRGRDP